MSLSDLKPIVLVRWFDAWQNGAMFYHQGRDYEPLEMRTIGFLMEETDTVVVICHDESSENGGYRCLSSIPVINIIEIIHIEVDLEV